jgi:hypothetical protein
MSTNEIYTVTTLSTGGKGNHSVPAAAPLSLPYTQHFDDEVVSAPPRLWYDQMGAWEVHAASTGTGNVMRQMVPIWPACWGYSCNGPTTYFGPADTLQPGTNLSFSILLEDDAELITSLFSINSNGTWSIGKVKGNTNGLFAAKSVHKIMAAVGTSQTTLVVDGKVVGVGETAPSLLRRDGSSDPFKLALNRYVFAEIDDFSIQ